MYHLVMVLKHFHLKNNFDLTNQYLDSSNRVIEQQDSSIQTTQLSSCILTHASCDIRKTMLMQAMCPILGKTVHNLYHPNQVPQVHM